jgi:hypothetical protein
MTAGRAQLLTLGVTEDWPVLRADGRESLQKERGKTLRKE